MTEEMIAAHAERHGLKLRDIGGDRGKVQSNLEAVGNNNGSSGDTGRFQLVAKGGEGFTEIVPPCYRRIFGPKLFDQ